MELVIASRNVHKIREFRDMLRAVKHVDVVSLLQFPNYQPPEETGDNFQSNAQKKAEHAVQELKTWVLADDSGLVVPALKGSPGIYSRRYAGEDATDAENRAKLLKELRSLPGVDRSAYFECSLVLAGPNGQLKKVKGICEGYIVEEERGRHGFGYDSLFVKHDYDKTFAELEETTKNKISHRRKAFERLVPFLSGIQ